MGIIIFHTNNRFDDFFSTVCIMSISYSIFVMHIKFVRQSSVHLNWFCKEFFINTWQLFPVYPGAQEQVYALTRSEHDPPFWHGEDSHSSISVSHKVPVWNNLDNETNSWSRPKPWSRMELPGLSWIILSYTMKKLSSTDHWIHPYTHKRIRWFHLCMKLHCNTAWDCTHLY